MEAINEMVPSKMVAISASVCACCLSGSSVREEKDIPTLPFVWCKESKSEAVLWFRFRVMQRHHMAGEEEKQVRMKDGMGHPRQLLSTEGFHPRRECCVRLL